MIRLRHILGSSALLLGVILACGPASQPAEGPDTSYPCGRWGVTCSNGACCDWGHICGVAGDPWRRCEVGYCCYDGDPFYGVTPDAGGADKRPPPELQPKVGVRHVAPQRPRSR